MTRWLLPLLVLVLAAGVAGAQPAAAQPPAAGQPVAAAQAAPAHGAPAPGVVLGHPDPKHPTTPAAKSACADLTRPHGDIVSSSGNGMALLFWLFALAAVGGAIFVITRKNLIAAVMGMVGSFFGIAAIYMMLYANFLAVLQVLVYAGAIMVLFVFVVMILNRPEDEPVAPQGRVGQTIGGLAILYLVARLAMLLWHVALPSATTALCAPGPTPEGYDWGSVRAVGTDLFGPGLFPFEAISILLLVAVVGAIAIARPLHEERHPGDRDDGDRGGHA